MKSVKLTVVLEITAVDHNDAETIIDQIKTRVQQAGWTCIQNYRTDEIVEP